MGTPLSQETAKELKDYKHLNSLCYAELGSLIGISGNTLSSRVVHCSGSPKGEMNTSSKVHKLIEHFFEKQNAKIDLSIIDTLELVRELKKRGATITF